MAEHAETKKGKDDNACVILTLGLLSWYIYTCLCMHTCYCFPISTFLGLSIFSHHHYSCHLGTVVIKEGFAQMMKGGIIMDVVNAEQARIAEEAGACSVMALDTVLPAESEGIVV